MLDIREVGREVAAENWVQKWAFVNMATNLLEFLYQLNKYHLFK
jgi:hypothetical protein